MSGRVDDVDAHVAACDRGAFGQNGETGLFQSRDMHEHIARTVIGLNETETFRRIIPFDYTSCHCLNSLRRLHYTTPDGALRPHLGQGFSRDARGWQGKIPALVA